MKRLETFLWLATVSTLPIIVCLVLGPGIGGFFNALRFVGPALAIIYPPIAVWMVWDHYRIELKRASS